MDCRTALAKQSRAPSLWRGVAAAHRRMSMRAGAEGRVGEKSGSQSGFARKPLNSFNSRKKEAWILLPLALNFLPNDLDFPSRGFENPSTSFVKYSRFTWNSPAPSRVHRAPRGRRGALVREGGARRSRCVNALGSSPGGSNPGPPPPPYDRWIASSFHSSQ